MTPAHRILLVEDEESLSIGLEFNLREEGYAVTRAADGRQALERFESGKYDLVVLDLMLPYVDGFEVARRIRTRSPQMPILMLTARTSSADRVRGLEIGADDYLTKPFHRKELLLRIRGMLKRKAWYLTSIESEPVVRIGECEIRFAELTLRSGTCIFRLTPREAMVLKYIVQRAGRVVTRKELLENVWQVPSDTETRTVDAFIARLRKMLEPDPSKPAYIRSVRSAGYRLTDAREPAAAKAARSGKTGVRPAARRTPPSGKRRR